MVTPCPLCHLSLDAWQSKLEGATGRSFQMPILHLSQLIGVAAGRRRVGAQVQAARRLRPAGARQARALRRAALRLAGAAAGGARVGLVRGRLGAAPRARGAGCPGCRRSSTGSGSRTSPTSTSASVARLGRGRARGGVGGRAAPRPRLRHRRPAHAARRGARRLRDLLARLPDAIRRARQPRLRVQPRPVLTAGGLGRPRAGDAARRLGARRSSCAAAACRSSASTRSRTGSASRTRSSSPTPTRTSASSSATSRACSTRLPRALRPRARRPHARRADRDPVARRADPPRAPALALQTEGLYRRPGGVMHVSPGLGTTFVPFRFFARPEATELVLAGID